MKLTRQSVLSASAVLVGGFIGASALVTFAQTSGWSAPTTPPPGGNVPAPINVGSGVPSLNLAGIQEKTNSLIIDGGLNVLGNLVISTGTPAVGKVLTALDNYGTVGWEAASSTGSNSIVYINPVVIASVPDANGVPWTTINLTNYGVPANASAVILSTFIEGGNVNGWNAYLYTRANSTSPTNQLAAIQTSGGGAPVLSNLNQGIYPISSSNGSASIDYKADTNTGYSSITLVGYVLGGPSSTVYVGGVTSFTAGGNITVTSTGPNGTGNVTINSTATQSSGTVGGGCYAFSSLAGSGYYTYTPWGQNVSASLNNNTQIYQSTCPTGYSAVTIDQGPSVQINRNSYYSQPTQLCLHN